MKKQIKAKVANKPVSAKTKRILMNVLAYLQEEPKRLNMRQWGVFHSPTEKEICIESNTECYLQKVPACRTTGCLAGTVLLVTEEGQNWLKKLGYVKETARYNYVKFPQSTPEKAAKILGITKTQANMLFYFKGWMSKVYGWQDKYSNEFRNAATPEGRLAATKKRVLHFIKTGR